MSIPPYPAISAVIPTINEERTIGAVIDGLKEFPDIEIVVVDTNSTDQTTEISKSKGAIVIQEPTRGYGLAYKTGLASASGEVIVCLDGDGTYPTEIVKPLVDLLLRSDVDFISCDRMTLRTHVNYTMLHFVGNSVLNLVVRVLFRYPLKDSQSGMWIFRKEVYNKMKGLSNGMSFSQEMKIEALRHGAFIEVPIRYGVRVVKPKLRTWKDGFSNLFHLLVKRVQE